MPLRNYWAESTPDYINEELTANAGSGIHQLTYSCYIPNTSHIKKMTCYAGMAIRGESAEEIQNLGRPMTWKHIVQMIEPGSDAFPSGRVVTLNKQAGAFRTSQAVQRHLLPPVGNNETIWPRVVTNYQADMHPVDQQMSYGSVNQSIGTREIQALFYVYGVHATVGGIYATTPNYRYGASLVLRVLYERTVA